MRSSGRRQDITLYAFDGTGNEDKDGDLHDTNVLNFFRGYDDPYRNDNPDLPRGSVYLKGIGKAAHTLVGDKFAEAFGVGGHHRVREAMQRLENNVAAGDTVIDVAGFSRGAAIAVSFANTLANRHPDWKIRFMGLWDVVGEFGLPGEHLQAGHDLSCPRNVTRCYHAMALDENRLLFPLTRMERKDKPVDGFTEVWFRGVHSDVGGGNGNRGMNWITLNWMFKAAQREGLPIVDGAVQQNAVDRDKPRVVKKHTVAIGPDRVVRFGDLVHASVARLAGRHPEPELTCPRIDDDFVISEVTRS